ncbi:MAG TPA: hypothetical protein VNL98_02385 [Gemmatimonadales bacterium]|nr:hypothetical protein [Gemmatimonadales bacterium]
MNRDMPLPMAFKLTFSLALGLSIMVTAIGLVAAVVELIRHGPTGLLSVAPRGVLTGLVIFASYFAAATLSAPLLALLWPVRDRWWGRSIIAGSLGLVVYGAVGLASVLAYVHLHLSIIDYESPADAWDSLWFGTLILAALSAVLGPIVWHLRPRDS